MRSAGLEPHAILAMRDCGECARSAYGQPVKRQSAAQEFRTFLGDCPPNCPVRLRALDRHFGPDRLHLVHCGRNLDRLAGLFFRGLPGLGCMPQVRARANRSLTAREIELQRVMNAAYPLEQRARPATFASDALLAADRPPRGLRHHRR
ncbi:hypothetical protein [Mangrovicoccus sp. HB161399]|uniref:hypothetical protein n=1 Tax=Mangrovicoccus sp. HB161399 TaxID=2720392 RepID=UPI0015554C14|nr:hypothetical protein [Mangrovicoccus sp. HB161399]